MSGLPSFVELVGRVSAVKSGMETPATVLAHLRTLRDEVRALRGNRVPMRSTELRSATADRVRARVAETAAVAREVRAAHRFLKGPRYGALLFRASEDDLALGARLGVEGETLHRELRAFDDELMLELRAAFPLVQRLAVDARSIPLHR